MTDDTFRGPNACKFKSDVVFGMPDDQTIWMKPTVFENITIWEECEPSGSQHLNAEDIVALFKEVPINIRRHVSCVILSPYYHPTVGEGPIASVCPKIGQIMIYPYSKERDELIRNMQGTHTMLHESIHVLDNIKGVASGIKFYACSPEWKNAMDLDSKLVSPRYYVTHNAEEVAKSSGKCQAEREDFADSAVCFLDKRHPTFFRRTYPNRTKLLEGILFDK